MIGISQALDSFFKQENNWKRYLMINWKNIMGPIAQHSRIEKIEHDTLVVGVANAVWMQELHGLSQVILTKINSNLEQPYLKKIRFKFASRKKFYKKNNVQTYKAPRPKHLLTPKEQRAIKSIPDKELGQALEKFLIRCYEVKHL